MKIEFEEHKHGMIEAQVYHSGEYAQKDMTAKEVFQIARDIAFHNYGTDAKGKKAKMDNIDRLERVAKKFGYMNIWYLVDWGREWGGHRFQREVQVSYEE